MAVVRLVKSKLVLPKKEATKKEEVAEGHRGDNFSKEEAPKKKKYCQFCRSHSEPHYFDAASLRRFLSDRGRIIPRMRTGTCSKHQRRVSQEIKRARHLALLPFTVRI